MTSVCPNEETLFLSIDGELDAQSQLDLLRHLSVCESCRRRVAELTSLTSGLSDVLAFEAPEVLVADAEFDVVTDQVLKVLRASGSIVPARKPGLVERARRFGSLVLKGTGKAAAMAVKGAGAVTGFAAKAAPAAEALANGGVQALKVAGKATKLAYRVAGGRQWRLAW